MYLMFCEKKMIYTSCVKTCGSTHIHQWEASNLTSVNVKHDNNKVSISRGGGLDECSICLSCKMLIALLKMKECETKELNTHEIKLSL